MGSEDFSPIFVLSLKHVEDEVVNWVLSILRAADLHACVRARSDGNDPRVQVLIGASDKALLLKASEYHLRKKCIDGTFRVYNHERKEEFISTGPCLEPAEIVYLVWQSIDNAQPIEKGCCVPCSDVRIKSHHTLLRLLKKCNWYEDCFPLHDHDRLRKLKGGIRSLTWLVDLSEFNEQLREYFGVQIAFYYAFFEFYIKWLMPAAIWGWLLFYLPTHPLVTILLAFLPNVAWWTLFLKFWTRRGNELAFEWGSLNFRVLETTRSNFRADELTMNPVTGNLEPSYSPYKRAAKQYLVGFPLIGVFCLFTIFTSVIQNKVSDSLASGSNGGVFLLITSALPRLLYQTASMRWNKEFKGLAVKLNDFENYRVASDYENNLTVKMFFFFGVSFVFGLVYEAIFKNNVGAIKKTIISFFLTRMANKQLKIAIVPYIKKKIKKASEEGIQSDRIAFQTENLMPYENPYYEYIEIYEDFGLVCMFSYLFPWCGGLALLYSYLKIRFDLFRLLHVYRRPIPKIVSGIGAWQRAFELIVVLSAILNVVQIALKPDVRMFFSSLSDTQYVLVFVTLEHVALAFMYCVSFGISDVTKNVQMARSKVEYIHQSDATEPCKKHI